MTDHHFEMLELLISEGVISKERVLELFERAIEIGSTQVQQAGSPREMQVIPLDTEERTPILGEEIIPGYRMSTE